MLSGVTACSLRSRCPPGPPLLARETRTRNQPAKPSLATAELRAREFDVGHESQRSALWRVGPHTNEHNCPLNTQRSSELQTIPGNTLVKDCTSIFKNRIEIRSEALTYRHLER